MTADDGHRWSDKFLLRMPDGLRDEIKATAAANMRSMNTEIIFRITSAAGLQHNPAPATALLATPAPTGVFAEIEEAASLGRLVLTNDGWSTWPSKREGSFFVATLTSRETRDRGRGMFTPLVQASGFGADARTAVSDAVEQFRRNEVAEWRPEMAEGAE